jgi:Xaa-Pro aminopeptidase
MKGYAAAVFPREGDPILLVIEPQLKDAKRMGWTKDILTFKGYDERDPRPPTMRSLDLCLQVLRERGLADKVGVELSMNFQICDRMVGEPTVFTQGYFDAFRKVAGEVVDAVPLLTEVRMIKTEQEVERMRLANELAALGMAHARQNIRPGMKEGEVGAMIEGHVHAQGIGYKASPPSPPPATAPSRRTSPPWSNSGWWPMATGPTSPRTSVRASSRPATTSCWTCC